MPRTGRGTEPGLQVGWRPAHAASGSRHVTTPPRSCNPRLVHLLHESNARITRSAVRIFSPERPVALIDWKREPNRPRGANRSRFVPIRTSSLALTASHRVDTDSAFPRALGKPFVGVAHRNQRSSIGRPRERARRPVRALRVGGCSSEFGHDRDARTRSRVATGEVCRAMDHSIHTRDQRTAANSSGSTLRRSDRAVGGSSLHTAPPTAPRKPAQFEATPSPARTSRGKRRCSTLSTHEAGPGSRSPDREIASSGGGRSSFVRAPRRSAIARYRRPIAHRTGTLQCSAIGRAMNVKRA